MPGQAQGKRPARFQYGRHWRDCQSSAGQALAEKQYDFLVIPGAASL